MTGLLLQTATDADLLLVLFVYLGILVSVVLSLVVLVKGVQGYRRAGDPALVALAAGILLISGAPLLVNLGLTTAGAVAPWVASALADGTQLLGLGVVLYAIYGTEP